MNLGADGVLFLGDVVRGPFVMQPRRSGMRKPMEVPGSWQKEIRVPQGSHTRPHYAYEIFPRIAVLLAPVADGTFDGRRFHVSYASTANASASLASLGTPN